MSRRIVLWQAGVIVAGGIFFLLLLVWVPTAFAATHQQALVLVYGDGTATVQETPTVDPTVTALNKAQLAAQVHQLQVQNDRSFVAWFWTFGASILAAFSAALTTVVGVLIAFNQWRQSQLDQKDKDRQNQRDGQTKQEEERFQKVVEELGSDKEEARVGGVILLHTFLGADYERFYHQVFELAVAYLRLQQPEAPVDGPPSTLSQALIGVFVHSLKVTRELKEIPKTRLDASGVYLDHANLRSADLHEAWMSNASLRRTILEETILVRTSLDEADLTDAKLKSADFSGASLQRATLSGANPEAAKSLKGAKMSGVIGLTEDQRKVCIQMGAIFEDTVAV